MTTPQHPALILFSDKHPLTAELNMKFFPDGERFRIEVKAPNRFADVDGKTVHTGFSTLLLDTLLGACTLGNLDPPVPIATVKLNCNHLRKARVGEELYCEAVFDGEENEIAYASGEIRRVSDDEVLSTAIGSFMVGSASRPLAEKQAKKP